MTVHKLTPEQFQSLASCVLDAVASIEGWDAEHPCWKSPIELEPSRAFLAELRRRLPRHFKVLPSKREKGTNQ
jgi:hypothetical protein